MLLDPAGSSFPVDGAAVSTSTVLWEVEPSVVERAETEPSVIELVEVSPVDLNSISSTSADSVTECSIAGSPTSSILVGFLCWKQDLPPTLCCTWPWQFQLVSLVSRLVHRWYQNQFCDLTLPL